jgi:hypothetical protein
MRLHVAGCAVPQYADNLDNSQRYCNRRFSAKQQILLRIWHSYGNVAEGFVFWDVVLCHWASSL